MEMFQDLMRQYRRNPDQFTDEQAEKIAREAKRLGIRFPRENKFGRKLAFDAVDSLALGMVPNSWRPKSRGEATFGETDADKWAGRLGLLGAVPTLGAGWAGRGAMWAGGKAVGKAGLQAGAKGAGYARNVGGKVMDRARSVEWRPNFERMGEGVGRVRNTFDEAGSAYRNASAKGITSMNRGRVATAYDNAVDGFYKGMNRMYAPRTRWRPNQIPYSNIGDQGRVRFYDRSLLNTIDPATL